ncbi:MAG TPA: hypothetical protein VEX70_06880 [Pyrinomonadaceae bacterium]|nr:hypothetical protein [Pyrinomonadaceae bacterium]
MNDQTKVNGHEGLPVTRLDVQHTPSETRTCHNYWCNYKTDRPLSRCPECGRPLLNAQTYRILGWVLVVVGLLLSITGASLLIFAAPKLVGGLGVKLFVWGVFGFLLAVGLTTMSAGFWQALFGKRSQPLMKVVIALAIAIMLIVTIGTAVL